MPYAPAQNILFQEKMGKVEQTKKSPSKSSLKSNFSLLWSSENKPAFFVEIFNQKVKD
jgi:hypothetical protein